MYTCTCKCIADLHNRYFNPIHRDRIHPHRHAASKVSTPLPKHLVTLASMGIARRTYFRQRIEIIMWRNSSRAYMLATAIEATENRSVRVRSVPQDRACYRQLAAASAATVVYGASLGTNERDVILACICRRARLLRPPCPAHVQRSVL